MQGQRIDIDDLARASALGTTRRQVLRAMVATIVGGIGFGARSGMATAQAPTVCVQDSGCRDDAADLCTGASCDGGTCTFFIATCIPGYVCCGNGACCPEAATCQTDADCLSDNADPCAGSSCQDGTCTPYLLTCVEGSVCCRGECAVACDDHATDPGCLTEDFPFDVAMCAGGFEAAPSALNFAN